MTKKRKYRELENYLFERLKDPEIVLAYLNEALMDEDQRVFLLALKDVVDAQDGDISALAEQAQLNRQNI